LPAPSQARETISTCLIDARNGGHIP